MLPTWLPDTVTTDLDRALHYTLLWGLEAVELRTLGRAPDRVPNVNEEKVRRRLRETEISAAAVVPGLFESTADAHALWMNDLTVLADVLAFCRRTGCRRVVVSAFTGAPDVGAMPRVVDALRRAGDLAARADARVVVLNEYDTHARTGTDLLALLDRVDSPYVEAGWDPAAGLIAGEPPEQTPDELLPRLGLVRVRDVRNDGDGWSDVVPGEGELDWQALTKRIARAGFDGPLSLDLRVDAPGSAGLHAGTNLVRWIRAARK